MEVFVNPSRMARLPRPAFLGALAMTMGVLSACATLSGTARSTFANDIQGQTFMTASGCGNEVTYVCVPPAYLSVPKGRVPICVPYVSAVASSGGGCGPLSSRGISSPLVSLETPSRPAPSHRRAFRATCPRPPARLDRRAAGGNRDRGRTGRCEARPWAGSHRRDGNRDLRASGHAEAPKHPRRFLVTA
jgi:hypothetical protein